MLGPYFFLVITVTYSRDCAHPGPQDKQCDNRNNTFFNVHNSGSMGHWHRLIVHVTVLKKECANIYFDPVVLH